MLDISEEREEWLIFETRHLLLACGVDAYLSAPLIEPTPRYLPRHWAPDLPHAEALTRRLLAHAGLADHVASFTSYAVHDEDEYDHHDRRLVAGWFSGVAQDTALFGINLNYVNDPVVVAGVMAHEVTHAFREFHGLHVEGAVDEELTDLTCVYLGFGILSANVSSRTVVQNVAAGTSVVRSWTGYLSVDDLCFLLALQVVARGYDEAAVRRVERLLADEQSVVFRRAVHELSTDREELLERLGITDPSCATPVFDLSRTWLEPAGEERGTRPWGHVAYRARTTSRGGRVTVALVAGFVGAFAVIAITGAAPIDFAPLMAIIALTIVVFNDVRRAYRCSACQRTFRGKPEECPACARYFIHTLDEPPDRFDVGEERARRIFRVRGTRATLYATQGWGIALALGVIATVVVFDGFVLAGSSLFGGVVGWFFGRRQRVDLCSSTACDTELPPGLTTCPRCSGEIYGEISHARDRLRAEEEAARAEAMKQ